MIIYKVTNIINNKIYIGQTINSLQKRQSKHFSEAKLYKKYLFPRALLKYGKENFIWEVIDEAKTKEELNEKEKFWIWFNASTDPNLGYNMSIGGCFLLSPEREQKRIEALIKKVYQYDILTGLYIKEYKSLKDACLEFNDKCGYIAKVCRRDKYAKTAFNYRWSYIKVDYIKIETNKKKVNMFSINGEYIKTFNSISEAARFINKPAGTSAISKVCKGELKNVYGYKWKYK